uniref:uncharacterized protein LOC122608555 n=1 Tax=Erigeron canadensis TaxID=72917 RepID=UPI001CB98429|nr:uncharacterized protein LOC122608555 [Erigeron canadensis]
MEVTNNPSRRLFLFGVFSVLLCLIGIQFMVNQDYQIAVVCMITKANSYLKRIYGYYWFQIDNDGDGNNAGANESNGSVVSNNDNGHVGTNEPVVQVVDVQSEDVETWIQINKVNFIAGISILLYIAIRKLPTTRSRIVMVVRTKLQLVLWTTIHVTTRVQTELLRIWLAIKLVKVLNVCKVLVQAATKLLHWFRDFVSKEEILKSIVYGGLTEIIASISVVAFFSDFDTTILNVIAFALAGLIGGCFFFVTNIWGLKKGGGNAYTEQLGRVNYFPFHATLATLSFIIFGMIPPSTFVFSFIKTNDKKLAIWVVSAVSLLCLSLLAIFKAYVITSITYRFKYVRTVLWYQVIALGVSICSYLASKMVKGSIEDIGLFNTSTCDAMSMSRHN